MDDFSGIRLVHKGRQCLHWAATVVVVKVLEDFIFWRGAGLGELCVFKPVQLL